MFEEMRRDISHLPKKDIRHPLIRLHGAWMASSYTEMAEIIPMIAAADLPAAKRDVIVHAVREAKDKIERMQYQIDLLQKFIDAAEGATP